MRQVRLTIQIPTHSVYSPTATLKQPASKQTVKERTQKYTTRVCVFAKIAIKREQLNLFKIAEHKQFHERSE